MSNQQTTRCAIRTLANSPEEVKEVHDALCPICRNGIRCIGDVGNCGFNGNDRYFSKYTMDIYVAAHILGMDVAEVIKLLQGPALRAESLDPRLKELGFNEFGTKG